MRPILAGFCVAVLAFAAPALAAGSGGAAPPPSDTHPTGTAGTNTPAGQTGARKARPHRQPARTKSRSRTLRGRP